MREGVPMPYPLFWLIQTILQIYIVVILVWVVLSWLVGFNVINPYNGFVRAIIQGTGALVEPALRPIRRILPSMGGLDFSPIVLLLLVQFLIVFLGWTYTRFGF